MLEGQSVSEPRSCGMHANDQRQRAWHVSDVERADACRWVMLTLVLCACAADSGAVSVREGGRIRHTSTRGLTGLAVRGMHLWLATGEQASRSHQDLHNAARCR